MSVWYLALLAGCFGVSFCGFDLSLLCLVCCVCLFCCGWVCCFCVWLSLEVDFPFFFWLWCGFGVLLVFLSVLLFCVVLCFVFCLTGGFG